MQLDGSSTVPKLNVPMQYELKINSNRKLKNEQIEIAWQGQGGVEKFKHYKEKLIRRGHAIRKWFKMTFGGTPKPGYEFLVMISAGKNLNDPSFKQEDQLIYSPPK